MEDLARGGQRIANYTVEFLPADAADDDDAWRTLVPVCAVLANGTVACDGGGELGGALGDRPDGHDPRDQYVGHKRIDFPIVDPASTPMRKLRFVCLRALGDDPTAFVRSFAVHQKRVPWEAPRSKR